MKTLPHPSGEDLERCVALYEEWDTANRGTVLELRRMTCPFCPKRFAKTVHQTAAARIVEHLREEA